MDSEHLGEFRLRFGIKPDEKDGFDRFKRRIIYAVEASLRDLSGIERRQLEETFAFRAGSSYVMATPLHSARGIVDELRRTPTLVLLFDRIQQLLWTFESFEGCYTRSNRADLKFLIQLEQAIELSPGIDVRLRVSPGRAELVPASIKLMDDAVDRVTQWLSQYQDVQKEFRQTLIIGASYAAGCLSS